MPIGVVSFGYEKYSDRDAIVRAALAIKPIKGFSGVISYEQTMSSDVPYKISGTVMYPLNHLTSLVTYFEQIGNSEVSYTLAYKMMI